MGKKLIGIAIIAVMLFGVFGLTACTESLADYKAKGKASIDAHIVTKTQSDYSTEKWAELLNAAAEGKQAVDNATNKGEVDTAVTVAKDEIDEIEMEELEGMFYSLDYAFDNGWLTTGQLQSIAYYYYEECIAHNHAECETFAPIPKNPSTLSNGIQTAIKQTYLGELQIRAENATLDNIQIANYLGTYNDCIIVGVTDNCFLYDYLFEPERTVGGVLFRSYCANFTQVWRVK